MTPTFIPDLLRRCLAKDPGRTLPDDKGHRHEIKEVRREVQSHAEVETTIPPLNSSTAPADSRAASTLVGAVSTQSPISQSTQPSSAEYIVSQIKTHKKGVFIALGILFVALAGLGIALYKGVFSKATPRDRKMQITRLVTGLNGRPGAVNISPDGKYVAYAVWEGGKASLWVRQVSQDTSLQLLPPVEQAWFAGTAFSKDSELIYFVGGNDKTNTLGSLYQIPVLGGREPKKILDHVSSQISLSPDGKQFVFGRAFQTTGESAMFIANIDGSGEPRKLLSRSGSEWLSGGFAWSPDGKRIAFISGTTEGGVAFTLREIPVEGGQGNCSRVVSGAAISSACIGSSKAQA